MVKKHHSLYTGQELSSTAQYPADEALNGCQKDKDNIK